MGRPTTLGIVLAAGSGSRMGYLGGILPKTMVPVRGRPLLSFALGTLAKLGADDVRVAILSGSEPAERYLRSLAPREMGFRSVRVVQFRRPTRSPLETLARTLPARAPGGTVAVVLGDDLTVSRGLPAWCGRFERSGASAAQAVVRERDRARIRGACEVRVDRTDRILEVHEKPLRPRWGLRGCGLYLFRGPELSRLLREALAARPSASLSDLIEMCARRRDALALRISGRNINVNTVGDLMTAWQLAPSDREAPL